MKKKDRSIYFLLILIIFPLTLIGQDSTNLFSRSNIEEYADFLFLSSQYGYAAEEYERLVFMDPANENYRLGLLRSYRYAGQYQKGVEAYHLFKVEQYTSGFELVKEYSRLSLLGDRPANLVPVLTDPTVDYAFRNNLDLTMRLLSYPEYNLNLEGLDQDVLHPDLLDLYAESFNIQYKSRFVAGSLSALVPGLGKVYTGRWKDGLISFLFVTSTAFQAYRAFDSKGVESVYGWIMGTLSAGFYIGNIYGSAKSARIYNRNKNARYHEKVTDFYIDTY